MTLFARAFAGIADGLKTAPPVPVRDFVINWADPADAFPQYTRAYGRIYEQQLWVWTVVNKLARGIGRLPLKVYRDKNGTRERAGSDDTLARLLAAPSGRLAPTHLKQAIVTDTAVYGNAFVLRVARSQRAIPTALVPVTPVGWEQLADGSWRWNSPVDGKAREYAPWEVMHFRHYSPARPNDLAISPLEPLRLTLAIEYAAQRYGVSSFENGARPSGILRTDKQLTPENRAALRQDVMKLHGGSKNAGKLAVLDNGLSWEKMSWDANESAVIDHRRLTREEVCAAYDVPPPMVGILDRATFSNIDTQTRMLYTDTLGPWLTMIDETFAVQLIGDVPELAGYSVEFELGEVLKGDIAARFTAYQQAINAGVFTQNEIRALENYPAKPDEDADRLHRPANLTPLAARPPVPAGQ